jgi:hypothetical protein
MVLARRFCGGVQGGILFCLAGRDGDPKERAANGGREISSLANAGNSALAATGAGNNTAFAFGLFPSAEVLPDA